ncbi:MAG: hypothetical protein K8M05_10335, partial [Deltaproteobacteria bacterium]|nr:hypothetical protein [Kofleriaceae bacterium]
MKPIGEPCGDVCQLAKTYVRLPTSTVAPPTVECRLEGEHLGVVGATVVVGSRTYVFASWQTSPQGSPIGFTLSGPSQVRYEVRTEADRDYGDTLVYEG